MQHYVAEWPQKSAEDEAARRRISLPPLRILPLVPASPSVPSPCPPRDSELQDILRQDRVVSQDGGLVLSMDDSVLRKWTDISCAYLTAIYCHSQRSFN